MVREIRIGRLWNKAFRQCHAVLFAVHGVDAGIEKQADYLVGH